MSLVLRLPPTLCRALSSPRLPPSWLPPSAIEGHYVRGMMEELGQGRIRHRRPLSSKLDVTSSRRGIPPMLLPLPHTRLSKRGQLDMVIYQMLMMRNSDLFHVFLFVWLKLRGLCSCVRARLASHSCFKMATVDITLAMSVDEALSERSRRLVREFI